VAKFSRRSIQWCSGKVANRQANRETARQTNKETNSRHYITSLADVIQETYLIQIPKHMKQIHRHILKHAGPDYDIWTH